MTDFHAVVLAAGRSDRMGREKAGLPWLEDKLLLVWTMEKLAQAGWQSVAVVRPERLEFWENFLPGKEVANPDPERGKTTSLATGIARVPSTAQWMLITAVDQPRSPALYRQLFATAQSCPAKILAPEKGHPIVLAGSFREQLLALDENSLGLRGLLDAHVREIHRVPDAQDPSWDLNTPEKYEEALAYFRAL